MLIDLSKDPIEVLREDGRYEAFEPNMEIKIPHDKPGDHALEHRRPVALNGHRLWIAPFEQQIAYKLWLGSEKDLEDAAHLHAAAKAVLIPEQIRFWMDKLGVPPGAREVLAP